MPSGDPPYSSCKINIFVYTFIQLDNNGGEVKISEFKRWLESQGVTVKNGTNHWKLYYQGRQSTLTRHPGQELNENLRKAILKRLGL